MMSGTSKYKVEKDKEPELGLDEVKEKYEKEYMSVREFAILVSEKKGHTITDKTIKNYLTAICELSDGLLELSDFKGGKTAKNSKIMFPPKSHRFLLALMTTDYFDGRRNDRKLNTREELYGQLIKSISEYLDESDLKVIKENPTYYNALLEINLSKHLTNELAILLRTIFHSDPVLRYQFMIETLYHFRKLRVWSSREDDSAMAKRMVYAHKLDELKDAVYQKGVFEAVEFDEFIVKYMALRIKDEDYQYVNDDELLSYPAMLLAKELFNIEIKGDSDIARELMNIEDSIEQVGRYIELTNKAKQVFDLTKVDEARMYGQIERLAKIEFLRPIVSSEDYERTVRFVEDSIKNDKYDILQMFLNCGRGGMSDEEIEKILQIKDGKKGDV